MKQTKFSTKLIVPPKVLGQEDGCIDITTIEVLDN
jgi:hypothetical protein